jgi:hypothetical protein
MGTRAILVGLLVAVLAAALFVPSATAGHAPSVKLALIPLPRSAIGPAVKNFAVTHNSGTLSNADAASHTSTATAGTFKKLGRETGYVLEYGDAFTGAAGLTDVHTGIDRYKTAAGAKRGLAFWQKEDSDLAALAHSGFSVTSVRVKVPAVGTKRFAYLTSYSAPNIAPVSVLDEQFVEGHYVLDVVVSAGSAAAAKALAPKLAKKLDARVRSALEGRLHGKPVKLPAKQTAGPPAGGPDLSAFALQASDLVGEATIDEEYVVNPAAVSDYSVFMLPAGQFQLLGQDIEWYPSANEASFYADFATAATLAQPGTAALDVSALGHGAQATVVEGAGQSFSGGWVVFSSGNLTEIIFMIRPGISVSSDVKSVAQAAANRLGAAGF